MSMSFSTDDLRKALDRIASELIGHKDSLTYIDSVTGDGDLGISMEKVAHCIMHELQTNETSSAAQLLLSCARQISVHAPSTMGTLMSFAIFEAAKILKDAPAIDDASMLLIPRKMVEVIMIHGRAQQGDKTVLDALIPYGETLVSAYVQSHDIGQAALEAACQAERSANATKGWLAKIGRAKWIGERSRHCPDGGAVVCAIIANAFISRQVSIDI